MWGYRVRLLGASITSAALVLLTQSIASASVWTIALQSASSEEAQANGVPAAPASPAASCPSSTTATIKVTWTAVAHASTYSVFDATTSATGTYSLVSSGIATASYTTATLPAGNYWFEVDAYEGTNWHSANSSATSETTTASSGTKCKQP